MFLSSVLESLKETLINSNRFTESTVEVTIDDKPLPTTGSISTTIYGSQCIRSSGKDNRIYQFNSEICITFRSGYAGRTKLSDINTSLSTLSDYSILLIDSSNILLSKIVSKVNTVKGAILTGFSTQIDPLTDEEKLIRSSLEGTTVIGPMRALGYTGKFIPRNDEFFTAFDTKRVTPGEFRNDTLEPAGYSSIITVSGPIIALGSACVDF